MKQVYKFSVFMKVMKRCYLPVIVELKPIAIKTPLDYHFVR